MRLQIYVGIVLLLVLGVARGYGQAAFGPEWQSGLVILQTGDTISGAVMLQPKKDLLMVYHDNTYETFGAQQVASLFLADEGAMYGSFPFGRKGKPQVPTFFEVVSVGPCYWLLARTRAKALGGILGHAEQNFGGQEPQRKKDFYLLETAGKVAALPSKRTSFAKLFAQADDALRERLKSLFFDCTSERDLKKLIQDFNTQQIPCSSLSPSY